MDESSANTFPSVPPAKAGSGNSRKVKIGGTFLNTTALRGRATMLVTSATLAWVGGYLDAFTFVGHGHVFATAMTGNVVLLGIDAASGSWQQCLPHLLPIFMYLIGVAAARAICQNRMGWRLQSPELSVLWIEIGVFFVLGWLPAQTPDFPITMSVALVASMQMTTFREVNGRSFSSTFTSSNLRTMIENAFDWIFGGRELSYFSAARDFAIICSMFLFGAVVGTLLTPRLHNRAVWVVAVLILLVQISLLRAVRVKADD